MTGTLDLILRSISWQFRYQPAKRVDMDSDKFMQYWTLDSKGIDEPNRRRNGWSNVQVINPDNGKNPLLYVKKQENYYRRTMAHLLRGITTVENEARSLYYLSAIGIKIPRILFWGIRREGNKEQAVLVTEHLQGYQSLADLLEDWGSGHSNNINGRRGIILALARELRKMHDAHIVHNSLYPKHIFVNTQTKEFSFIDLEKAKIRWTRMACSLRDLDSLNRHTFGISRTDRLRFLMAYCNTKRRTPEVSKLWKALSQRYKEKIPMTQ